MKTSVLNVGIVGCGLIGKKRAEALGVDFRLVAAADIVLDRARAVAAPHSGCQVFEDWTCVVEHPEVDLVLVCTTNDLLTPVALAALANDKHVLVEKPAARTLQELEQLARAAEASDALVKVGFNHRFHPAFLEARRIWESGELGRLMYIRGRYGHGGRPGYEREWRADPVISGGGELLDQGVHLIDLARWFAGEFVGVEGHVATYFWRMPVEDNGFMLLETAEGQVAWLHVSCTEWKNLFSFEIFGERGKLQIDGLGRSYGTERLTFFAMRPEMGPPDTSSWEYPGEDTSWRAELEYFRACIERRQEPEGGVHDALQAMRIVQHLYRSRRAAASGART